MRVLECNGFNVAPTTKNDGLAPIIYTVRKGLTVHRVRVDPGPGIIECDFCHSFSCEHVEAVRTHLTLQPLSP